MSEVETTAIRPPHIWKTRYNFMYGYGLEKVQDMVNQFAETHEVQSVNLSSCLISQKGLMLCDRVSDAEFATQYVAVVSYLCDITERQIQRQLAKELNDKVNGRILHAANRYDPAGFCDAGKSADEIREEIKNSPEYKARYLELEKEFGAKPDESPF
jgi:hypothetical protein